MVAKEGLVEGGGSIRSIVSGGDIDDEIARGKELDMVHDEGLLL